MIQIHGVLRLVAFKLMSIPPQFRFCSTVRPIISLLQAGLFLSLCLWHTDLSAQDLEILTLVEHNIESPPFVEGQSIDGIDGWTTDFPASNPLLFTDRVGDPTSVLFGPTSGAITVGPFATGGTFPDITIPEEARTLTINMSGHFRSRSSQGFQARMRLTGTDGSNFILSLGALAFTDPPIPLFISGTDFEDERVNLNSEDQHSQVDHRSLDLTMFYDQRTGSGLVTANNLEGDGLPTVISEFTDNFLVSELGTLAGDVFLAGPDSAISALSVQVGVVPEPSSFTALACLSLLMLGSRRRK